VGAILSEGKHKNSKKRLKYTKLNPGIHLISRISHRKGFRGFGILKPYSQTAMEPRTAPFSVAASQIGDTQRIRFSSGRTINTKPTPTTSKTITRLPHMQNINLPNGTRVYKITLFGCGGTSPASTLLSNKATDLYLGVGKSSLTGQFVSCMWTKGYDPMINDPFRKEIVVNGNDYVLEMLPQPFQIGFATILLSQTHHHA
jgi:hypothetical protein